eukprot:829737-Amphidinium_carterae.1
MAHGHGKLSHVNGDTYEGHWFEDRAQGPGTFTHQDTAMVESTKSLLLAFQREAMDKGGRCSVRQDSNKHSAI